MRGRQKSGLCNNQHKHKNPRSTSIQTNTFRNLAKKQIGEGAYSGPKSKIVNIYLKTDDD